MMSHAMKGQKRVVFWVLAPEAAQVGICGDFNGWDGQKHLLKRKPGGFWEKTLTLHPGRYEYKFQVDGSWYLDPVNTRNHSLCVNNFGACNHVIIVNG
ncbi:MAG: glycogen-binding domain-containing protein [Desulfobacteraceae bacterium]|nr:glycogen-binding domain-containing protein [Desulfobacteraceae bacterium]